MTGRWIRRRRFSIEVPVKAGSKSVSAFFWAKKTNTWCTASLEKRDRRLAGATQDFGRFNEQLGFPGDKRGEGFEKGR